MWARSMRGGRDVEGELSMRGMGGWKRDETGSECMSGVREVHIKEKEEVRNVNREEDS